MSEDTTIGHLIDRVAEAGGSAVVNVNGSSYRVTIYSVTVIEEAQR